ncbi:MULTISPECIES: DUF6458 family protein [Streptomyces]|uniref:DUF6458 family protein n=1 Tax=Streptomyces TaxID=1883 RepID=UPI00226D94FC|nr:MULTISPECIES: DUF6458 family protein [unclassified Streptomyces]MCY0940020.1 DUF6458 family protein [Streptomyces sp. H34-AA3]MCY0948210.1 DUF6458 family protein [Streptomyces sp. H27-S2]MCZ4083684.1 DUF6458 family protein [Streptomyces sp. H34-S5]
MTGLGGCIGLIVVGAILTFATDWEMRSVDLDLVGLIMMAVGAIGLAVYSSVLKRRRTVGAVPVVQERRDVI